MNIDLATIEAAISDLHFPVLVCDVRNAPADAIYVGRAMPKYRNAKLAPALLAAIHAGSPLANPYKADDGRGNAIARFAEHFARAIDTHALRPLFNELVTRVLNGEHIALACWCVEEMRPAYRNPVEHNDGCHADVIAFAIDAAVQLYHEEQAATYKRLFGEQEIVEAEEDDLFAFIRPGAHLTPVLAQRRTCLACGLFLPQQRPPLCEPCRVTPGLADAARERVARFQRGLAQLHAGWSAYLDVLDEDTGNRWHALTTARAKALSLAERPVAKGQSDTALKRFHRSLDLTIAAGEPIVKVIEAEQRYLERLAHLEHQLARWEGVLGAIERTI